MTAPFSSPARTLLLSPPRLLCTLYVRKFHHHHHPICRLGASTSMSTSMSTSTIITPRPTPISIQTASASVAGTRSGNSRLRALSSASRPDGGSGKETNERGGRDGDGDDKDDGTSSEIVLTPGEAVVAASRLGMWAAIGVFALACAYYIGKELFPTKMSPNRVFDRSFEIVRRHPHVTQRFGEPLKAYGRDHGSHREGRRNFIEHTEYKDAEDGSNRTRVRYNLQGRYGAAFVFAEVSSQMKSGEFVYVLVQDKSNGRVYTLVDNRAALTAQRLAGGANTAGSKVMSDLLTGGGRGGGAK